MRNALLATFENQPALLTEGAEQRFEAFLGEAFETLGRIEGVNDNPVMADDFWFSPDDWRAQFRPYVVKDGLLLIPVKGVLLYGVGYQLGNWATGYTYITKALERGLADPMVRGIAFICDSPGGHVAGNFELVDRIYEARGVKPIRAFAAEGAYSAAYSIASATSRITVTRSGGVGSIGVLRVHYDYSKMLDDIGMKVSFIKFGKHKTDGNSYEPLPEDVRNRFQARVDELGEEFVSIVARNRGMDAQDVRNTEALTFTAKEATSNGLADAIGSLDDAIAVFAADMSNQEDENMTTQDKSAVDQAAVDTARQEGFDAGKAEGLAEGARAEKDRINAIVDSEEGKKRPSAAFAAAMGTNMPADEAIAFISKLAEETAETTAPVETDGDNGDAAKSGKDAGKEFEAAMDKSGNPNLGAPEETKLTKAEQAMLDAGYKPKTKTAA